MASTEGFIVFVTDQIVGFRNVRYRKMFGEYMVYVNDKPILLICDDTVYVKMHDEIKEQMQGAETGTPYKGAKLHYILDIENQEHTMEIVRVLEVITPLPKPKKKRMHGAQA